MTASISWLTLGDATGDGVYNPLDATDILVRRCRWPWTVALRPSALRTRPSSATSTTTGPWIPPDVTLMNRKLAGFSDPQFPPLPSGPHHCPDRARSDDQPAHQLDGRSRRRRGRPRQYRYGPSSRQHRTHGGDPGPALRSQGLQRLGSGRAAGIAAPGWSGLAASNSDQRPNPARSASTSTAPVLSRARPVAAW